MTQREKDEPLLLHNRTRHNNFEFPRSNYIGIDTFPEQDLSLLGTVQKLKYRNMYLVDREKEDTVPSELYDEYIVHEDEFTIVRCDNIEPYVMIGLRLDGKVVLVTDSMCWNNKITIYPVQMYDYLGIKVSDQYYATRTETTATVIRVDDGEPCNTVLMELLPERKMRFVLGDECQSKILEKVTKYKSMDQLSGDILLNMKGRKLYGIS